MTISNQLPRWAPRVARHKIRQLYETDGHGIYDIPNLDVNRSWYPSRRSASARQGAEVDVEDVADQS